MGGWETGRQAGGPGLTVAWQLERGAWTQTPEWSGGPGPSPESQSGEPSSLGTGCLLVSSHNAKHYTQSTGWGCGLIQGVAGPAILSEALVMKYLKPALQFWATLKRCIKAEGLAAGWMTDRVCRLGPRSASGSTQVPIGGELHPKQHLQHLSTPSTICDSPHSHGEQAGPSCLGCLESGSRDKELRGRPFGWEVALKPREGAGKVGKGGKADKWVHD